MPLTEEQKKNLSPEQRRALEMTSRNQEIPDAGQAMMPQAGGAPLAGPWVPPVAPSLAPTATTPVGMPPMTTEDAGAPPQAIQPAGVPPENAADAPPLPAVQAQPGWIPMTQDSGSSGKVLTPEFHQHVKNAAESFQKSIDLNTKASLEENKIRGVQSQADYIQAQADQQQQERLSNYAQNAYNNAYQNQMKAAQDVRNSRVDPNHYWKEKGTANQIASAIAVGLGSLGSSITHGPNFAMQIIDGAINRDMSAQESEAKKKMSLYDMARDATQGTRQMSADEQARFNAGKIARLEVGKQMLESQMTGIKAQRVLGQAEAMKSAFEEQQAKLAAETASTFSSHTHNVMNAGGTEGGITAENYIPALNAVADPETKKTVNALQANAEHITRLTDQLLALRKEHGVKVGTYGTDAYEQATALEKQLVTRAMQQMRMRGASKEAQEHFRGEFGNVHSWRDIDDKIIKNFADTARSGVTEEAQALGARFLPKGVVPPNLVVGRPKRVPRSVEQESAEDE